MSLPVFFLVCVYTMPLATECVSDHGKALCKGIDGICVTERDGYYIVSAICLAFGVIFLVAFIIPTARKLQRESLFKHSMTSLMQKIIIVLSISAWRIKMS